MACALVLGMASPALADTAADQAAITRQLVRWANAFNAKDAAAVCDLFAPDLIATVRGAPESGRDAVCARLAAALAKPGRQMRYTPEIGEIIVSGDLAAVRVVWTLSVRRAGGMHTSQEPGLDIFRREPDSAPGKSSASWRSRPIRTAHPPPASKLSRE